MEKNYYVLELLQDIEPILHGPSPMNGNAIRAMTICAKPIRNFAMAYFAYPPAGKLN